MKARAITSSVVILLMMLALVAVARGQPSSFIINGADATSYLSVTGSSELNTLIASVGPRFVMQSANAVQFLGLTPVSSDLQTLLEQVGNRFVIQYANANRMHTLSYPVTLIGDTLPPQATEFSANTIGQGTVKITWTTDEFATSVVTYGISSGVYTQTVSDTLYYKSHAVTLSGLTLGSTYYYKFGGTDRSGNTYQSPEYSFTAKMFVYLPLVKKQ